MTRMDLFGTSLYPITTPGATKDYYNHLGCRFEFSNTYPRTLPTREEGQEYVQLLEIKDKLVSWGDREIRKRYRRLNYFERFCDWRPFKVWDKYGIGLETAAGERLVPPYFADVFNQFNAMTERLAFIPVSDGENWALSSITEPPVLMTDFIYKAIIPERWEGRLFLVQDKESMKWGALRVKWPILNQAHKFRHHAPTLKCLLPCIADEIYEDMLFTDCEPTLFHVTRVGEKFGILTPSGYSPIIYDKLETDDENLIFRLTSNDLSRSDIVTYHEPDINS